MGDRPHPRQHCRVYRSAECGKAVGIYSIPADLLKAGGESMAQCLHVVVAAVWHTSIIPRPIEGHGHPSLEGEKGLLGLQQSPWRYTIPSEVLAHILRHMRPLQLRHQIPEQAGFTLGKSTIDRILALCIIVKRHREFRHGLLAA
ncbi:uncharacterized protein [Penaeus vannamei]|uniref:uncharacterized protein n=1 Tax=Penaeus vannamei TaxID=6689 RepID=UPI00387F9B97